MKSKTVSQKRINEKWFIVDAKGGRIGRISSIVAEILMGKNDPLVREYLDPKAFVVVINTKDINVPLKRGMTKFYKRYSGFPGGLKVISLEEQMKKNDTFVIENAVKGMLPKTKKSDKIMARLKVYSDSNHPHAPQNPIAIDIKNYKL